MTFQESIHTVLVKKYATFNGRAARSEFWWFWLASVLLSIGFALLGMITGAVGAFDAIDSIVSLAILVPTLAVTCRRLHDTGRSGWWQMMPIAPALIAGFSLGAGSDTLGWIAIVIAAILFIVLIVWLASAGDHGPNQYGNDPLQPDTDAEIFA